MGDMDAQEAAAAKVSAERKLARGDVRGCRKLVEKLSRSKSTVEGLEQLQVVLEVHEVVKSRQADVIDYYAILQLPPLCDDESTIKKAFRRMALLLHPDKNKTAGADEAFKHVKAAHECLSDNQQKEDYDAKYLARLSSGASQRAFSEDFHSRCFVCRSLVLCRGDALGQLVRCPTCQSPFVALEIPEEASAVDAMAHFFAATQHSPLDLSHGGGFSSWEQTTAFHLNSAAAQLHTAAHLFQSHVPGFDESMKLFHQQAASFTAMAEAAAAMASAAAGRPPRA